MLLPQSRARIAAALATVVALAASALAVQQMIPASAVGSAPSVRVAPAPASLIQGVVVDQVGRPVDDIVVKAVKATGEVAASALTYASNWPGGKQHGYFFVEVPRGSYTLTLAKDGYKSVEYDAGLITKRRKKISMGEIVIQKISAPTTTSASLGKVSISTKDKGSVTVTVAPAKGRGTVGGEVEVREGKKVVGAAPLGKKGTVTITLAKLAAGTHKLTAYFLGTADHKASSSKELTLTVVRKKR